MAHAYTPGLAVTPSAIVDKKRILPIKGEVLVKQGDAVAPDTVVARTLLPGKVQSENVAGALGIAPADLPGVLVRKEGESVSRGDVVARRSGFFGLFSSEAVAPVTGTIETISPITGHVLYREPPIPVEVRAYVRGTVREVHPGEGVIVETRGALVQGIFGIGGETHGILEMLVDDPATPVTADLLREDHRGKILAGGSLITLDALRKAASLGVRAIVVGGFHDGDLRALLGYDLGVAITGTEKIGTTLVVTEGFGPLEMARKTFDLLASLRGREASVNGATQIRAGVIRPEVIVPMSSDGASAQKSAGHEAGLMEIGSLVRIIRAPWFGQIGSVTALPPELIAIETEAKVRILQVALRDGRKATLPRANVELIEE